MRRTWKKLSETTLLAHTRLTVKEDDVELPSGHRTKYLYFDPGHAAAQVIAINSKGKILVQKEYSYPPNEWLYQFPGGSVDKGETPAQGAKRELAEEAGIAGRLNKIGWFYVDNRRWDAKFHVFVASNLKPATAKKDIEEEFEDYWFTADEITEMIAKGKITNYSMLAAWAIYKSRMLY